MRSSVGRWAILAFLALPARSALAEDTDPRQGVRIDQFQLASPESAFFRSEGPHKPQDSGVEFAVRVTLDEGLNQLKAVGVDTAGKADKPVFLVNNALVARVDGSISPVHWLSIELGIPFSLAESGHSLKGFGGDFLPAGKGPGLGDPRVGAHIRVIDQPKLGFLFGGRVWGPFATKQTYLGDGQLRAEVDLALTGDREKFLYGLTAAIAPTFFASRDGDRVAVSGALYARLGKFAAIGVEPSFELVQAVTPTVKASDTPGTTKNVEAVFEPLGGLRFHVGILQFGVAAGPGFGSAGAAGFRGLASVGVFVEGKPPPPPPVGPSDRDVDGIPDTEDACPDEAGPRNADPKKNGCPGHDRDADGIPDEEDFCPDRPGIKYSDPKGNGCPDSDNDGIPDPVDTCPHEPGKGQGGCPLHARLAKDTFTITPPITFAPASDKLSADSRAAIEEIAATAHANPKAIDQVSFGIGTKGAPAALSDKRAQAILLVLRAAALESEHYEVSLRDDIAGGKVVVKVVHP